MKADERHKLKTNELAVWIRELPGKLRAHQNSILLVVLVIAAAAVGWLIYRRHLDQKLASAWVDYSAAEAAGDPDQFREVINEHPDMPPVTGLAGYGLGLALMGEANREETVHNRTRFADRLAEAAEAFEAALQRPYHPITTPGSRYQLAGIARINADPKRARELYRQIIEDEKADGAIRDMAQAALAAMDEQPVELVFATTPRRAPTEATVPIPPMSGLGEPGTDGLGNIVAPKTPFLDESGETPTVKDEPNTGEPEAPKAPKTPFDEQNSESGDDADGE